MTRPSPSSVKGGAAQSRVPRHRRDWKKLSEREKIERLERDIFYSERRAAEYEQDLLECESRLRLVFRDIGRQRRRLEELERNARKAEREARKTEASLSIDGAES
jgi:hypothetical protein